jgi:hypothetical protein
MRVPKRVPVHQRKADQQVPQSESSHGKRPYEAPTTQYTKYHAQGGSSASSECASHHIPKKPQHQVYTAMTQVYTSSKGQ